MYYLAFWENDPPHHKALVVVVYVLELLQTVLCTKDAFAEFGTGFGDLEALERVGLLWFSVPLLSALGAFPNIVVPLFPHLT